MQNNQDATDNFETARISKKSFSFDQKRNTNLKYKLDLSMNESDKIIRENYENHID